MNQKNIQKKVTYIVLAILFLEVVAFGGWYFTQPTYKTTVLSIVNDHESPTKNSFFQSVTNKTTPSIISTYNALSIYSALNEPINNKDSIASFIMGSYNSSTGLFSNKNVSSLETTFQAVTALSILGKLSEVNKTQIIQAVLALKTSDSLFREYNEYNTSNQMSVGEIDHLYQALATLNILYQNNTELLNTINITKTITTINSLEGGDGGMLEGIFYTVPNMKNAYYTALVFTLLNKSITYYESLGFRLVDLENWMQSMYTTKGFKMQVDSEPTVEATAYALVSYKDFNMSSQDIQKNFPDGVTSIENFLDSNFTHDSSRNPLDVLHDLMNPQLNNLMTSKLNKPYFNQSAQFYFGSTFAITILAFVINTIINLMFALKEDDSKYFEGSLHIVVKEIIDEDDEDLSELTTILGETIDSIELLPYEDDEKLGLLKAYSEDVYFLLLYETFSGLVKKVEKYSNDDEVLSVIDFLESDIFFTVAEGREHLKNNLITE